MYYQVKLCLLPFRPLFRLIVFTTAQTPCKNNRKKEPKPKLISFLTNFKLFIVKIHIYVRLCTMTRIVLFCDVMHFDMTTYNLSLCINVCLTQAVSQE